MENLNSAISVGEFVVRNPDKAAVFEKLGIDYCCGGKRSLNEVCAEKKLELSKVIEMLSSTANSPTNTRYIDVQEMALSFLVDHIVDTHHAYLRREIPRIKALLEKTIAAHGAGHPELKKIQITFVQMAEELFMHMHKEEEILFPAIRALEGATSCPDFHCGSIANPINVMEMEHDSAGNALLTIKTLSKAYDVPEDACPTYSSLLYSLKDLEEDLHQHIHKENNVLFPRALAKEAGLARL